MVSIIDKPDHLSHHRTLLAKCDAQTWRDMQRRRQLPVGAKWSNQRGAVAPHGWTEQQCEDWRQMKEERRLPRYGSSGPEMTPEATSEAVSAVLEQSTGHQRKRAELFKSIIGYDGSLSNRG